MIRKRAADGDDAALVVVALPKTAKAPFRVLEKLRLRGGFETQADAIFKAMQKYRVVDVGIDTTGVGAAVFQLVVKRFPTLEACATRPS
jgi:transposase